MASKKKLKEKLQEIIGLGDKVVRNPGEFPSDVKERWIVSAKNEETNSAWEKLAIFPSRIEADRYASDVIPKLFDGRFEVQIYLETEKKLIRLAINLRRFKLRHAFRANDENFDRCFFRAFAHVERASRSIEERFVKSEDNVYRLIFSVLSV